MKTHIPKPGEPVAFSWSFMKVPNSFVDLLLPNITHDGFRVLMHVWRNNYGRRGMVGGQRWLPEEQRRSHYESNWEVISARQMGNRFGFKSLDPKTRGLSRVTVTNIFTSLRRDRILVSTNPGHAAGIADSPNHYAIGPEIWQLLGTGNFSWQALAEKGIEVEKSQPCKPTYKARFNRPSPIDEATWKKLDYGRVDAKTLRSHGIQLTGPNRDWLEVEPEFVKGGLGTDICTKAYFELPTCVEDFIAPNIPIKLYPLLIFIIRNTLGRYSAIHDSLEAQDRTAAYEKCRSFRTYEQVASVLAVSQRTAKRLVKWAKDNGILDVRTVRRRDGSYGKNGYLPGEEVWRVFKTGDFSPEYRARNLVATKRGNAAYNPYAEELHDDDVA